MGFRKIEATGFDIAEMQIARACELTQDICRLPGVTLTLDTRDVTEPLSEPDRHYDLTLSLYCVLNHLPRARLAAAIDELARVTRGLFITTVRTVGSIPTAFVDSLDHTRAFLLDNDRDRFEVELLDGQHLSFTAHLFAAGELRQVMERRFTIEHLRGLDLFHSRFSPDPRWNPDELPDGERLGEELAQLEERFATHPAIINRATHLLLIGRPRLG